MWNYLKSLRQKLVFKVLLSAGLVLLVSIALWSYFNISYQQESIMSEVETSLVRLSNTIRLGTHYAMLHNAREDIKQIVNNISKQEDITAIRIFNKPGYIAYSSDQQELQREIGLSDERCAVCHSQSPTRSQLGIEERIRIVSPPGSDSRRVGIITPIYNEPGCVQGGCHAHSPEEKVLGLLDLEVSLQQADAKLLSYTYRTLYFAVFVFFATYLAFVLFVQRFVTSPVRDMIKATKRIARGEQYPQIQPIQRDELGQLIKSINLMSREVQEKHDEINRQWEKYQQLFETVPCLITVQDKNYKLMSYNREFALKFAPKPGQFCFSAYKGRMEKCLDCPVEKTFRDGRSHWSEETGYVKDGTQAHWLVTTAPMRNAAGEVDSVMEMCLDITTRKRLEEDLRRSEKKYWAIFNNIPNPVFVLDPSNLRILDCNDRVSPVYGWHKEELTGTSFLDLFSPNDRQNAFQLIRSSQIINQMKQVTRKGTVIFVSIRISPSEYGDKQVLLVTTSDITKRLETEQQLIQSNKMTTLGEMASGIAHELNQPLAVIKTASNYLRKKKAKGEAVRDEIMTTMLEEIDANVDRSTKIINHLRDFSRKPNMELVPVQLGEVMAKAMDIFSQQLKLREIEVKWDLEEGLPDIKGEQGQLEQVFINLLINARDAIEDRWGYKDGGWGRKEILLRTQRVDGSVQAQVKDTGCGIPKALLDRIFEPFFTTKEVSKGTGLGLSITYRIVQDCGGRIDVDSIEGQGTTFTLTFPAAEER